jgi:predicted nucleic acid-binding protein
MRLSALLKDISRIYLDTAPVVYYVEENERYTECVDLVFSLIDAGDLNAIASPITLAECLVMPYQKGQKRLAEAFTALLLQSNSVQFVPLDQWIADKAAQVRARYNLTLPDALQIATALVAGCDAFLTNDITLKRVAELNVIVLDECESA